MDNKLTPQIAAMYWGSQVCTKTDNGILIGDMSAISEEHIFIKDSTNGSNIACIISHCQLELTPLSEISDEDALKVSEIFGHNKPSKELGRELVNGYFFENGDYNPDGFWLNDGKKIADFLRSKSYDVDGLIENGLAIKKEVSNG